jgi:hypothetical protein
MGQLQGAVRELMYRANLAISYSFFFHRDIYLLPI